MRIALVSEHASPLAGIGGVDAGGQNVHVAELAAGLVRLGHSVSVYTRLDDADLAEQVTTPAGYEVVHVPAGPAARVPKDDLWPHMAAFGDHLAEMLKFQQPDIVHAHFWMSAWAAARAVRRLNLPLVVTFHVLGSVKRRYQGPADTSPLNRIRVEVAVAGAADRIVATATEEVRELALLGVPSSKVSVVPCGIDLEHFTPASTTNASPSVPKRSCRYRLLSVGRLVPRKGYEIMIEALTWLPETELLIAGGASSDATPEPEHDRLVTIAERLGVSDRVRLVGQIDRADMPGLLRSADLVVCSPWYEPFGIVPLEAMACGVPVVASAVGGMLDTVVDGVTGMLVTPRDPVALAEVVGTLLEAPSRRTEFARAGLDRVRSCYSWDRVAADTAAVYQQPVSLHGAGLVGSHL
ncbi:MAG TPA: glycosyltransferase [Propionibacteriaceae bacterium]|nr:glycosyltransferase [Propionibacteriaceae bacterium]